MGKKPQTIIAFVCIILGFMISIQFKSVKKNDNLKTKQFQRADELQVELNKELQTNKNLYEQILEQQKDIESLRQEVSKNSVYSQSLFEQLKKAEILAGLTDVEGKGVTVTLNDSKVKNDGNVKFDEHVFLIHDEDILMVINELADAGAEAISINDERLVSTSEIRCAGAIISVNNNRYGPPFIIKAIGNPETLEAALNLRGGVKDILTAYGIEIGVKKVAKIQVHAYKSVVKYEYALPVDREAE